MKLLGLPFSVAAHRSLAGQTWLFQRTECYSHIAGTRRESSYGFPGHQKPRQQPRQQQNHDQRQDATPIRRSPSRPPSDMDMDLDSILETTMRNMNHASDQDMPLMDFTKTKLPPKIALLCHSLGMAKPETKKAVNSGHMKLEFSLSTKHCFHDYHMREISDAMSPFQDWAVDKHIVKHEEPLWFNVLELGGKKVKPVIKTRGVKRHKHAFSEALRINGYDRVGNPLSEKEAREAGTIPAATGLYGTVRVKLFDLKGVCSVPFDEVVKFWSKNITSKIRSELGRRMSQDQGGLDAGEPVQSPLGRLLEEAGGSRGGPRERNVIRKMPSGRDIASNAGRSAPERRPQAGAKDGNKADARPPSAAIRPSRPVRPDRRSAASWV